ncbi:MIP/aquaporin family protein [Flavihumibacter sp. CACIAM 22H1]|uniref:MIP/aquaporin family protein n=1 Tax=Flavihumibacter sp. CACIAM 22H1 TaxID=1812911 RepID=UPI000A8A1921|nr:MIP/aquaporin family protein [Flavihumibacter sp. CACIAM 22H1]
MMNPYLAEFVGTAILLAFGNGVVANVLLKQSKGHNSGWIVITFGWAMAVFLGVLAVSKFSGAHLNPAVSICLALTGKFPWADVPLYILAQLAGAFTGAVLMWLCYKDHFYDTEDQGLKLAVFSTGPAIRKPFSNFLTEAIATGIFLLLVLLIIAPTDSLGSLDALPVALLVLGVGLCFGGPTGYAINPARDLGPRIAHFLLPLGPKGSSDWGYAWVPVAGPIAGSFLAAALYKILF